MLNAAYIYICICNVVGKAAPNEHVFLDVDPCTII